ncbi:MAG: EamA family transporter [Actinomycetota bacterium]
MGSLLALLSSFLWGTADYLAGNLSKKYRALAVTGVSQFFGLLFGVTVIAIGTQFGSPFLKPTLDWDGYFVAGLIAGISGFIGLLAFYSGLATGRMGVVSPISSLSVLIPLTVAYVQGERASTLQAVGISVALLGAFLASGPEIKGGLPIKPLVFAVIAAFGFGGALTFIAIGAKIDSMHTMTSMRVASVTVCIVIAISFRTIGGFAIRVFPLLVFIGVADFLANFFLGVATTKGLVSVALVLGSLFPIVTALLAFKFLHERLHKVQYLGIFFAILGVCLISAG